MTEAKARRLVIAGIAGRMGRALVERARATEGIELVAGTERGGTAEGLGELPIFESLAEALEQTTPDVVVDFTAPEASAAHARTCAEKDVALVCGTTGLTDGGVAQLQAAARKVPVVWAPNMSLGVNVLYAVVAKVAAALGSEFDAEVLELHHRKKKDAPSGTALKLAEEIARATSRTREDFRTARSGQVGERSASEIGLAALRGGDVVGEHTVFFMGEGERVELTHRATSRQAFAGGAIRAALWLAGKSPGLYDMRDVLGLSE